MRYKLILSYEGTNYHGYQRQPKLTTVQSELEKAIFKMTNQEIVTFAASRTDKGVHAIGQVVHFDTDLKIEPLTWVRSLNYLLPDDIKVLKVIKTSNQFHSRHSAKSKIYHYRLSKKESDIFKQRFESFYPNLDYNLIRQAMLDVIGEHDFCAFAKEEKNKPTIKIIYSFKIKETKDAYTFVVHGNNFLRYMVRSIIGNLIAIGQGKKPINHLRVMLDKKDRKLTAKTAAAKGLILYKIYYK